MTTITEVSDAPSNTGTPYEIGVGDVFLGTVLTSSDTDWVETRFELGFGYYATLRGDGSPTQQTGNRLELNTATGQQVDVSTGSTARVEITPTADATYYFEIDGQFSSSTGTYQLELFREVANSIATNAGLEVGANLVSSIDYQGDDDFFRISLEAGKGYYATMRGDGAAAQISSSRLYLRDESSQQVDVGTGSTALVALTPTTGGTYYLQADGQFNSSAGSYRLDLIEEVGAGTGTVAQIDVSTQAGTGDIAQSAVDFSGDTDWFRVSLEQGYGYFAQLTGDGNAGTLSSGRVTLRDAAGTQLSTAAGSAPVAQVSPDADGTFYVAVEGQFNSSTGGYTLQAVREVSGDFGTLATLGDGEILNGSLDYQTDIDMYRITLVAGEDYTFALTGDGGSTAISRAYLQLFDTSGTAATSLLSSFSGALETVFTAEQSGTYFVRAGNTSSSGRAGDYLLSAFNTSVEGDALANILRGSALNERISGFDGNDLVSGGGGNDWLIGGGGDDTLFGDSAAAAYYGNSAVSAQVYRLYQATLDRAPDVQGHANWTGRIATGERSLQEVTAGFVGSPEFTAAFPVDATAEDFVRLLYANVLDNDTPDAQGLARWTGELANGASRADVVLGFSESPQFVAETRAAANAYTAGSVTSSWGDDVFRLYQATLDRAPDVQGQTNWTGRLSTGERTLEEVAAGFVGSDEFTAAFPADASADSFVRLLYQNVLNNDTPDAAGLARWTGELEGGASRAQVVLGFSQSPQFAAETAADLKQWMRDQGVDDRIDGGAGANLLAGGQFTDVFVFTANNGSSNTVADLEAWDFIDLKTFGYGSAGAARAQMSELGGTVSFADQGVTITFRDTVLSEITDDMILI